MNKQTVFKSEEKFYRIPALICLKNGDQSKTLLAFAEQRKTPKDECAEKLVMKKGEVEENSSVKTVEWSDLEVVEKAHIDGYRPMNPCPVYDKVNKTLFLFFICVKNCITEKCQKKCYCNKTRLCYITSTDCGKTWSDVTDLTKQLPDIQTWATFAVGPGHGIQTEGNRLIIPVHAYCSSRSNCVLCWCCKSFHVSRLVCCCLSCCCHSCCCDSCCCHSCCCDSCCCDSGCCDSGCCDPDSYALSLYKDPDHSWTFGKMFETKSGECEMAEISKNHIYCNARSTNGFRVETFSDDNGVNFSEDKSAQKLTETDSGCQGSVISFPAKNPSGESSNKWLLFTHPTSTSSRIDLGVYLNKSPNDPNAWSKPKVINDGPSGYSDLAYIDDDDGWFVCLFECGEQEIHEQIAFVTFTEDDIEKNIPV